MPNTLCRFPFAIFPLKNIPQKNLSVVISSYQKIIKTSQLGKGVDKGYYGT